MKIAEGGGRGRGDGEGERIKQKPYRKLEAPEIFSFNSRLSVQNLFAIELSVPHLLPFCDFPLLRQGSRCVQCFNRVERERRGNSYQERDERRGSAARVVVLLETPNKGGDVDRKTSSLFFSLPLPLLQLLSRRTNSTLVLSRLRRCKRK